MATHFVLPFSLLLGGLADAAAGPTPWAVLKCKFSDQSQEPAFDPLFITGPDGMAGYWSGVSYGQINLDGSAVYPADGGWYTLPITLAQAQAFGQATRRRQILDACVAAANGLDAAKFFSVIAIVNVPIDSGSDKRRVLLDPLAWNASFAAHEMGHVYLKNPAFEDHSFDDSQMVYGPGYKPGEYGDGWDIMSAMTFGVDFPTFKGRFGASGPGLDAHNLNKLGWLPANRILTWDGQFQSPILAGVNHPEAIGHLIVKVPIEPGNPDHYYTIEHRRKTDWDRGIPRDTVLIHEVRPNGVCYLIRANGGPERLPGQIFRDVANNVAITVLSMDAASSTATVNIGRNEVWVDFHYQGVVRLGTFDLPYTTLAGGLNAVAYGGTLKIKAGSRNETATISKAMRIEAVGGPVTIGQ